MAIPDDIAAVRGNQSLTADEKRSQIYTIKTTALLDVILNGKPAPGPIPPLLGRTFTKDGVDYHVNSATITPETALEVSVTFTRAPAEPVTHTIIYVNPPVLPRIITGNEKQDLIQAAIEMMEGFV